MKTSIALAVWNGARFLQEQLDSFVAQTRLPDELVICDNGSTDGTQEIVRSFAARAPFPVHLHQNETNIGYANNFARATACCSHELIFWSDHDDVWLPGKISDFHDRFEAEPDVLLLFSDSELVDPSLRPQGGTFFGAVGFTEKKRAWIRGDRAWRVFLRPNMVAGNTIAFRAPVGKAMRQVPPGLVHDEWLLTTVSAMGKIGFFEKPYVRYRLHGGQNVSVIAGSPGTRLLARWRRAGRLDRERLREQAGHQTAYLAQPEIAAHAELSTALKEKRAWLEARAELPRWRILRIPQILAQRARYARFENGPSTMLKDLLLS